MSKHYHVLCGMGGGYMPNTNDLCSTKRSAEDTAKWHADQWREEAWHAAECGEKLTIRGNKREGYVISSDSPYDLGHYIEIVECCEEDCSEHLED